MGDPGAGAGDGAQHSRDSRRRREPHLLRRPVRRILDLRHRLSRDSHRRPHPPAIGGLHFFGIVQYIGADRTADWVEFYSQIFGFAPLPDSVRFGILPRGLLLQSPCRSFYLQLIEPDDVARYSPAEEHLQRIGFGTPDVLATVGILQKRGIEFLVSEKVHASERGALTTASLGSVMFELVHDEPAPAAAPR